MNFKKLLSIFIGLFISLALQSSFANPNICSGREFSNELEEIQFERCSNGFKFATFNRYANVNIFGAAGNQSNKLESEIKMKINIFSVCENIFPLQKEMQTIRI